MFTLKVKYNCWGTDMKKIFNYFHDNPVLVNFIMILIFATGVFSILNMKREVYPATETDTMIVTVSYPGASPVDVETNVIIPLEDRIKKISGVKDYVSISLENGAKLYIYLQDKLVDPREVKDEIIRELTNVPDIPADVEDINIINANPKRMSVYTFGITSRDDNGDMQNLFNFYDNLERKLKKVEGVGEVRVQGYLDPEIKIQVDPDKIKKYNISLIDVVDSINARNVRSSGGSIQSVVKDQNIVTIGQFENPLDVKDVIIRANYSGNRILVKDIASVRRGHKKENIEVFINQKKGITVSVVKTENADITDTIKSVESFLEQNRAKFGKQFTITPVEDRSLSIKALLNVVVSNALIGFVLVFIILVLFLDFKSAFWTAFGIPVTIMMTMTFMFINNISLNIITLGAIITVLGMLVDDAIVISENIHYHKLQGVSNREAGFKGLMEVMVPVLLSILTTIVAFLPLLAIKGKMGLFIKIFPVIITVALLASFIESVFLLPHHVAHGKKKEKKEKKWFLKAMNIYQELLVKVLRFRYLVLLFFVIILAVTGLLSAKAFTRFVLIKDDSSDTLLINLEAPNGTNLSRTTELLGSMEKAIISQIDPETVVSVNSITGNHKVKSINDRGNYENWAQIALYLIPASSRKESTKEIMHRLKKYVKKNGKMGFEKVLFIKRVIGPDPGRGVDVKLAGNNLEALKKASGELTAFLETLDGVTDIDSTSKPGKEEIVVKFDYLALARVGLDVATVSRVVKTAFDGSVVTTFQSDDKKIDYRLELSPEYKRDRDFLKNLLIPNKQGRLIPLREIARLDVQPGFTVIDHYNGDKAVAITANINKQVTTAKNVMKQVKMHFKQNLAEKYPGVYLVGGGEAAETDKTLSDLMIAFILALMAVYTILLILFKDPVQPILVLIVIPFGLTGAILAFILHGIPLSFMGMIGLIGLSGVVVNDSIVMIEFINKLVKNNSFSDKKVLIHTISEGAKRRLRPVVLTTLTTVGGLIPTVYGIGGKAQSLTPTVMAMAYGIMFASILTLFFLPSLYLVVLDIKSLFQKKVVAGD
jgi:multidrug efflux pump subunit AcrB